MTVSFFHYTSVSGLRQIISSGRINESSHGNNHAHFGEGTYGTSLSPDEGRGEIARNNWGKHGKYYIRNGKMAMAIEVKIPSDKVKRANHRGRDILVHEGPVKLSDYTYTEWTVPATDYSAYFSDSDDDGADLFDLLSIW
ncbi:hypothetical protein V1264_010866 [Littorina saxatilis]|uniref:Tox-ART-HYD1 domain-containing protein n=1 Tax=Littorina saxatilis TaxID=31220 RepID=A0AAN9BTA5_9CAEN